jgi:flagellar basal-body rod protein FlgF
MERLTYTAMNAMQIHTQNQRLIAAGLANQNTTGFKRDYAEISSVYMTDALGKDRVFPSRKEGAVDLEQGKVMPTDNPMDISVDGNGFMVGQKDNGEKVLTRRGDLKIGADRILRNGENLQILGDAGPITVPPNESLSTSRDGTVSYKAIGADSTTPPSVLSRLQLVNVPPANVIKGMDSFLRPKDGAIPASDSKVEISSKGLESSNVSSIDSMVDMLNSSRAFEISFKLISTSRDLDAESAKLMRSQG